LSFKGHAAVDEEDVGFGFGHGGYYSKNLNLKINYKK